MLLIGRHQLGLNFGLFVLLALEEWILPLQTGLPAPVALDELFRQLLDCASLDNQLGLPAGTCNDAIVPGLSGCCGISLRTLTTVQICSLSKVKFASLMLIQTSKLTLLPMALGMVTSVMRNHDRTLRTSFQQSVPSKGAETLSVHCSLVLWKKWA